MQASETYMITWHARVYKLDKITPSGVPDINGQPGNAPEPCQATTPEKASALIRWPELKKSDGRKQ